MKIIHGLLVASMALSAVVAGAQTGSQPSGAAAAAPPAQQAAPQQPKVPPQPMPLRSLDQPPAPPAEPVFPPVDPKNFTADAPTADTVNAFLKALWGHDPSLVWRVMAIQKTPADGVSKVVVLAAKRGVAGNPQTLIFHVLPDGKHAIADQAGVISFGATPFAELRKTLQDRADGPYRGASSKDLMIVEFADLQCPVCKTGAATMDQLTKDFPNARVVFQPFPLVDKHPFAYKAATYGYCVQTKKDNAAFFVFAEDVFAHQDDLTPEKADQTLKNAVTKAGLDPAAVDACAATPEAKAWVDTSIKLAEEVGIGGVPAVIVNGRPVGLPNAQFTYEMLKNMISFQALQDGVSTGAPAAADTDTKKPPTLGTDKK